MVKEIIKGIVVFVIRVHDCVVKVIFISENIFRKIFFSKITPV